MSISYSDAARPESVGESLSRAWQAIRANVWLFAGFTLLFAIAYGIVAIIPLLNLSIYLFSFVLPVSIFTAVEAADGGQEIQFADFFGWTPRLSRLLVGMLVQIGIALAVFVPLLLLFLFLGFTIRPAEFGPGLFTSVGFMLLGLLGVVFGVVFGVFTFSMNFLLLKTDLSIGEVMRLSWRTGWGNLGGIILLALLGIGLYLLGLMALVAGLLIAVPIKYGTQYFFLRSRFPDETRDQWDFDSRTPDEPYRLS